MKRLQIGAVLACLFASAVGVRAQEKAATADEIITIDGAKNPELIPNWAAWLESFRFMSLPAKPEVPIPSTIYAVTSPEQRALVRKEALFVIAQETELGQRVLKLQEGLTAENLADRTEQVNALELKRRQAALDARDRLLVALPPEAQAALREFVERTRRGYQVRTLKSKLQQFMLPE
jgi:hypothetical protein